jgi:hypothetical protein
MTAPAMTARGRRPFDPLFPRSLRLLGRPRPLIADRRIPHAHRQLMLGAVEAAAAKLDAEQAAGLLSGEDRLYLGALRAFAFGGGRSGQHRGLFIVGLADVQACRDPEYWSSALVHDGVHAWLQARGRPYLDEIAPCTAQIDYLARTGGDAAFIRHVALFRDSRSRQRTRRGEQI